MLAYQSYNVKSPLNGEAARWVADNQDRLPLDEVSLLVEEAETRKRPVVSQKPLVKQPHRVPMTDVPLSSAESAAAPSEEAVVECISTLCMHCNTRYSVSANRRGRTVKRKVCHENFVFE